jgi:hypothetical protein
MTEPTTVPVTGTDASTFSNRWTTELRASFALAWPLIVAQLAQNLLFTTDVVLMGWLGPKYLAAGTLAGAFLVPFQLTGIGIVGAVAPLVAQARGRGDTKAVRRIVRQGFWVAILVATLLVPIVLSIRPIYLPSARTRKSRRWQRATCLPASGCSIRRWASWWCARSCRPLPQRASFSSSPASAYWSTRCSPMR